MEGNLISESSSQQQIMKQMHTILSHSIIENYIYWKLMHTTLLLKDLWDFMYGTIDLVSTSL